MVTTLTLLKQLIAQPSLTPHEAGTFAIIENILRPLGFHLEYMNAGGVTNLWATHGQGSPLFCLAGHLDVVPTGPIEHWQSDPFTPVERDGYLYGRGAADMKASIAAMLKACEQFIQMHPNHAGTLALLFTSDEEGPATHGTVHVVNTLEQRGTVIDYCLIGEPTSEAQLGDVIKHGRRGSLSAKLTIHGTQGHIAYPQLADNPIHRFAPLLAELTQTTWDQGEAFFPPTSFQISTIQAGTGAANIIPGHLDIAFNFRHAPISSAEYLKERIHQLLNRHTLRYDIQWRSSAPFLTTPGTFTDTVCASIQDVTKQHPKLATNGGTSDGRFISRLCKQVVDFGPVNATIHKIDECIRIEDLEPLRAIFLRCLERILG
jgi:succinyl-diaminopimelate desuccinylase